jgi:hypothetical protein
VFVERSVKSLLARSSIALIASSLMSAASTTTAVAQPIPGTTCAVFPPDSIFNTDISALPVNPQSATWMANMTQNAFLHPDLGTTAQQYGIPINVAPPPTTGVTPTFLFDSESDHPAEGYPIDQTTKIEGGPGAPSGSDRHALVVSSTNCKLYEIYNLQNFINGQTPQAGSGAVWDLSSNAMRPIGWTSADAAGLPMAPLLLRSDEVLAGSITHAIRFTAHCTHGYIWPGSHDAGSCDATYPPMGARFRLKSTFNISGFSASSQVVLTAFQHYGMILADNGADWFFGGTTDDWWGTAAGSTLVSELKTIPATQFDAVDESSLQVAANSYQARSGYMRTPSGPAATGTSTTEEVFVRGQDNALWSSNLSGTTFAGWTSRGGLTKAAPGATATSASNTDVFVQGVDGKLWTIKETSGAFGQWTSLGGIITAGPTASNGFVANREDVFVRGGDRGIWQITSTDGGATWGKYSGVGGITVDSVGVAASSGELDIAVWGADGAVWWNQLKTAWGGWATLGGRAIYAPAVDSCSAGHVDVWVVGVDGHLWHNGTTNGGSSWAGWSDKGGLWTSNLSAFCHPGTTSVDVFGRGTDGSLWQFAEAGQ